MDIIRKYIGEWYIPAIRLTDIAEILIITVIVYEIMLWIKNTKAWMLLKGMVMLGVFILFAYIFRMHTILYLARESVSYTHLTLPTICSACCISAGTATGTGKAGREKPVE